VLTGERSQSKKLKLGGAKKNQAENAGDNTALASSSTAVPKYTFW